MSISFYLRCEETKKAVHVAEQSSAWFRGADYPNVVGAFCLAHETKNIQIVDGVHFDNFMEYEVWKPENVIDEFSALTGRSINGL